MHRHDSEKLQDGIFRGLVEQSHNWSTNRESSALRLTLMECMLSEMLEAPSHVCERIIAGGHEGIDRLHSTTWIFAAYCRYHVGRLTRIVLNLQGSFLDINLRNTMRRLHWQSDRHPIGNRRRASKIESRLKQQVCLDSLIGLIEHLWSKR